MFAQRKLVAGLLMGVLLGAVAMLAVGDLPRLHAQQPGEPTPDPEINWIYFWRHQWWKLRKAEENEITEATPKVGVEIMFDTAANTIIYASPEMNTIAAAPMPPFYSLRSIRNGDEYVVFKFHTRTGETWEWLQGSQWSKVADPQPGKGATYELLLTPLADDKYSALRLNQHNGITWTLANNPDGGSKWVRLTEPQ
ncbi:MAG: hypothetical protein SFU86_02635 [Pirellulaceae bacterium]|nr:hypothetical protein [Pirellulaceae bacterium]